VSDIDMIKVNEIMDWKDVTSFVQWFI